jgi:hypothetical protein
MLLHLRLHAISLIVFILALSMNPRLYSQDWGAFGSILSQMDSTQRQDYLNNLSQMQQPGSVGNYLAGVAQDSLRAALNGANPLTGLTGTIPPIGLVSDSVSSLSHYFGFSALDSNALLHQVDTIHSLFTLNFDSLRLVFPQQQGTFNNAPYVLNTVYPIDQGLYPNHLDTLKTNQQLAFGGTPASGIGNFTQLFNQIFNSALFTRIEIFGGKQNGRARYYNNYYVTELPVMGARSVEQFDRKIEPRWRFQGSWFPTAQTLGTNDTPTSFKKNEAFMYNGSFEVMFNPAFRFLSFNMRAITTLGIDAATYAPAHKTSSQPNNVGNSTGWGPILGVGMSTKVGSTTAYMMSTYSLGNVVCGPLYAKSNYKYSSFRAEAGIVINNVATARYEMSLGNQWSANSMKAVHYHQFTIGLPLTKLFR